ncbi:hypothetical protein TFUB4_01990 [Tannerella forsythia]|jgi:hypothetical protein|nr:hypothetical protein CLI86_04135 [Tannerella forsythia]PDP71643.1 hypothetical protein CLI85_03775 [Tannerella forsythia]SCQ22252.1 hypothetical protein TFUB4_01990 [Tannerella forsythia]
MMQLYVETLHQMELLFKINIFYLIHSINTLAKESIKLLKFRILQNIIPYKKNKIKLLIILDKF